MPRGIRAVGDDDWREFSRLLIKGPERLQDKAVRKFSSSLCSWKNAHLLRTVAYRGSDFLRDCLMTWIAGVLDADVSRDALIRVMSCCTSTEKMKCKALAGVGKARMHSRCTG